MSIDVGVNVQANLDPIVQATPKGLSTLLSLLLGKRYIDARRQATLSAAQNTVDVQKILEGKGTFNQESGALVATPDSNNIRELVRAVVQEEEITNLINCTINAANDLSDKQILTKRKSPKSSCIAGEMRQSSSPRKLLKPYGERSFQKRYRPPIASAYEPWTLSRV
ncbi:hypothetical protein [Achromobacter denitrificans]|uniref:Uncharacterized protein n=1 Tax=Achromobacter denitrificans TaxID=32002 RepID=A0ABZ3G155_ACHDE